MDEVSMAVYPLYSRKANALAVKNATLAEDDLFLTE